MSFQQSGGSRTPFPLRYFDGSGDSIENCTAIKTTSQIPMQTVRCLRPQGQRGGNPTSRPLRYFNPNGDERGCGCGVTTGMTDMFYRSNFARETARRLEEQHGGQCPYGGPGLGLGLGMGPGGCPFCPFAQSGGGPVGAPMTIPNYGQNQNIAHQSQDSTHATTGFSYRFNTNTTCSPFCKLHGTNLPTFNPVNRNAN